MRSLRQELQITILFLTAFLILILEYFTLETNLYVYAYNNPVVFVDPEGKVPIVAVALAAARAVPVVIRYVPRIASATNTALRYTANKALRYGIKPGYRYVIKPGYRYALKPGWRYAVKPAIRHAVMPALRSGSAWLGSLASVGGYAAGQLYTGQELTWGGNSSNDLLILIGKTQFFE